MHESTKLLPTFCCPCDQRNAAEDGRITFTLPTVFRSITSKGDLDEILSLFPVTLLIGVFGWSNYSRSTFMELTSEEDWLTNRSIGLGVLCLGNADQIRLISGEVSSHLAKANTEPILYCFLRDALQGVDSGPENWKKSRIGYSYSQALSALFPVNDMFAVPGDAELERQNFSQ